MYESEVVDEEPFFDALKVIFLSCYFSINLSQIFVHISYFQSEDIIKEHGLFLIPQDLVLLALKNGKIC